MTEPATTRPLTDERRGLRRLLDVLVALAATVEGAAFLSVSGFVVAFWSLVLRAWLRLGGLPHPSTGNPFVGDYRPSPLDPKVFELHSFLVWSTLVAATILVPVALLLTVASLPIRRLRQPRAVTAALLLATLLAVLTLLLDPVHGLWTWFLD